MILTIYNEIRNKSLLQSYTYIIYYYIIIILLNLSIGNYMAISIYRMYHKYLWFCIIDIILLLLF